MKTRKTTWMLHSPCPDLTFLSTRSQSSPSPLFLSVVTTRSLRAKRASKRFSADGSQVSCVRRRLALDARATHSLHFTISVLPALPRVAVARICKNACGTSRDGSTKNRRITCALFRPPLSQVSSSRRLTLTHKQDLETGALGPCREA